MVGRLCEECRPREVLLQFVRSDLTARQSQIVQEVRSMGNPVVCEIAAKVGVSPRQAKLDLDALVDKRVLMVEREAKHYRYHPVLP